MQAYSYRHSQPRRAVRLARRSVRLAERVHVDNPDIHDWQARAWAHYGNGLRICGDYRGAELAFARARDRATQGAGAPADAARLCEFEASLCYLQHRTEMAVDRLRMALDLRLADADSLAAVRDLVKLAVIQGAEEPLAALQTLVYAGEILDGEEHPGLAGEILHNIAVFALDAGATDLAQAIYLQASAVSCCTCEGKVRRSRWLRGRIAASFGELQTAAEDLAAVREEFAAADCPLEAAQAGLDLSLVLAQAGEVGRVRSVLMETRALFAMLSLAPESRAADLLAMAIEGVALEVLPALIAAVRRDARPAPRSFR